MNHLLPLVATAVASSGDSIWSVTVIYALLFGALYFFMIHPQQKKKKAEEALHKDVQVGDEITTIGGIVGRIVAIEEESESFVLETGIDRTRIIAKHWALGKINTVHEDDKQTILHRLKRNQYILLLLRISMKCREHAGGVFYMKGPKRAKSNKERSQDPVRKVLRPVVFGILAGAVICTVLLLVLSLILVAAKQLPRNLLQPITVLIAAPGAFFTGYTAARVSGEHGVLYDADSTPLLFELPLLAGLTVSGESVPAFMLTKGLIMILIGAIAGILPVSKKSRRK